MAAKLKVSHVKISNILGIEELEFAPGGFTEVSGANGTGKTSTINALRAALSGGHDATLLRNGTDKGEIVLVLDDGTQIKKSITAEKTDVTILRDEKKLSRPAAAIAALHDVLSVNPVEFLRAPEKSRVDALLQAMPLTVDRNWLLDQADVDCDKEPPELAKLDGLDLIEACKKLVFDERTGVNRAARDKEGTINQLRATLPEEVPDAPPTDASLLAKVNEIDQVRDKEVQRIADKLAGVKAQHDETVAALRKKIDDIKAQAEADIAIVRAEIDKDVEWLNGIKAKASASDAEARATHAHDRAGVQSQIESIEAAQKQHTRFEQTKETVSRLSGELDGLKEEAGTLSEALEALDAYKAELLASLPIPGLEVIEGKLLRHGVPFDRLNTAQQVEIAVEIAKLRAGDLGLICVDGIELLDPDHYEAFRSHSLSSGLQMIVSRVSGGELEVMSKESRHVGE